jgi:hypothetical protein
MANQNKWAIMGGIALNVEYTRKYGFDATAAAKVTAKLVAVPPPGLFQAAVQADLAGRLKRAAALPLPVVILPTLPPQLAPLPLDEEEESPPLSLLIAEKAGLGYTLDDGVLAPSSGQVAADGLLIHRVARRAKGCTITFDDGSDPVEFVFADAGAADEDEFDEDEFDENLAPWKAQNDGEFGEDNDSEDMNDDETEEAPLYLLIPEKAGKAYRLNDSIYPEVTGLVADDGALFYIPAPDATLVKITFEDDPEVYEFAIERD